MRGWLRNYSPVEDPRSRLICLPHAGGAPTFFRGWADHLPDDMQLLAVCYPGRQDRLDEPCISRMEVMVRELAGVLVPLLDRTVGLFGHSMGAAIAFEVARYLEERHRLRPAGVFVSGRAAPHRAAPTQVHLLSDAALLRAATSVGGLDPAVVADAELSQLILRALRSDFTLLGNYRPARDGRIGAPIVAYHGEADDVRIADVRAWSEVTTGGCAIRVFPGGHFYLVDSEQDLVTDLQDQLGRL